MNPFNYSQAKINQIFGDVKVLYRNDSEWLSVSGFDDGVWFD